MRSSSPDELGRVTLGLNAGLDISAVKNAKFKIALVNSNMPRWFIGEYFDPPSKRTIESGCAMNLEDFDLVVFNDEPLIEHPMKREGLKVGPSTVIAHNIVNLLSEALPIDSKDLPHTLQLGIGTTPNALAELLAVMGLSFAGVWSEMFSDGILHNYKEGLIRSVRKKEGRYLRDNIVVGFVLGSKDLYRTMHMNPDFAVLPQSVVNDEEMIAHNDYMVSINSALSVDLKGQVAASAIDQEIYSGVGGQRNFASAALKSKGGLAIIALPSVVTTKEGVRESRIVSVHGEGARHTLEAELAVTVITDHGTAVLQDLSDDERATEMLKVAHPDWVASLGKEIRQLPAMQGVGAISPRIVLLKNNEQVVVRPATPNDIPAIKTYLRSQTPIDLYTRYMYAASISYLTSEDRMNDLYVHSLDFVGHAAFVAESQGAIIGVVHAFKSENKQDCEVAFSRLSGRKREGVGYHLMSALLEWAKENKMEKLHATTFISNTAMRNLFIRFGFTASPNNEDRRAVNYSGMTTELADTYKR